ncbi:peptidylprolyl isomerase [Magnetospirillum sulfuroxidans]|uniref:Parvulin-like PPIase n=1 Tax=Magnetospirillum sulfuroxidans TaxID=611300 RepID=A0ABS5IFD9_9PROT|nr:peptidylprolyl isomerase [Magnetospirillum sulfuroxidans]MBR9973135.1 peptidylprolyl isomerase [Magnetospirillum sulfuroxidans]
MKTSFAAAFAAPFALALAVAALPALAADKPSVVAEVNGTKIHEADLIAYQRTLPPQMASQAPYEALQDMAVNNMLVAEQAKKEGLEKDPELKQLYQQLLVKVWMNKHLRSEVTPAAIKAAYDGYLTSAKPEDEVRARHILLETEDQAKAVIAELKKGADFTETAKAKSKDPSAKQNGGDLGYFTQGEMVPQFSTAAFGMKAGELLDNPVQSQFGWHVIKVEDRRTATPPTLEQATPAIREDLAEKLAQKLVADIRAKAKVTLYDRDGKTVEKK